MTKRVSRPAAPGLFDLASAPPAPVRVLVSGLSSEQITSARLMIQVLQRDIARLERQLAQPPTSWWEYNTQVVEVNALTAITLKSLVGLLPADLQPLVTTLLDLRAQVIQRDVVEEEVPVNGAGVPEEG